MRAAGDAGRYAAIVEGDLMREIIRCIFIAAFCSLVASPLLANPKKPAKVVITGKYSDLRLSEMSGDPVGMEIVIMARRGGYYASVLKPEGSLGRPVLVKLQVKGSQIRFSFLRKPGGPVRRFAGRITAGWLVGKFAGEERVRYLKRKSGNRG